MEVTVSQEKDVTIEFILAEAKRIFKLAKSLKGSRSHREIMDVIAQHHKQFLQAYPVAVQLMAVGQYNRKAFHAWLMEIAANPWQSEEEFLYAQAEYIIHMHRVKSPHLNEAELDQLRTQARKAMIADANELKESLEEASRKLREEKKRYAELNRKELLAYFMGEAADIDPTDE